MDKKEIKKRKRKRNRLIKSLVLVVAFVIAIGATFGATMAYFGGKSNKVNYDMQLKMGLYVGVPEQTAGSVYAYVVPSQIVTADCQFSVKSAKTVTDTAVNDVNTGSNGLIRAKIEFGGIDGVTLDGGAAGQVYFPVNLGNSVVANFVKHATDGYYYLVTGTSAGTNDSMYVVESSKGEKSFNFELRVSIPSTLTNEHAGQKITLSVIYEVIQADFYDASGKLATTVGNSSAIFDTVVSIDANYKYGNAS